MFKKCLMTDNSVYSVMRKDNVMFYPVQCSEESIFYFFLNLEQMTFLGVSYLLVLYFCYCF